MLKKRLKNSLGLVPDLPRFRGGLGWMIVCGVVLCAGGAAAQDTVTEPPANSVLETEQLQDEAAVGPDSDDKKVHVTIIETEVNAGQLLPGDENNDSVPAGRKKDLPSAVLDPAAFSAGPELPETAGSTDKLERLSRVEIQAGQIIKLNQSLRRIIEENEKLRAEKEEMDRMLRTVRGQRNLERNRVESAMKERDQAKEDIKAIAQKSAQYQEEVARMKKTLEFKEQWLDSRAQVYNSGDFLLVPEKGALAPASISAGDQNVFKTLRYDLKTASERLKKMDEQLGKEGVAGSSAPGAADSGRIADSQTTAILGEINAISEQNDDLRRDEAKVHYNMGNKLFHAGEYARAVTEYQKALELRPDDANTHFNLAFVSGEFMKDYKTAEKHYRLYLILNPGAPDANLVKEKVIEAELILKTMLSNSPSENEWQRNRAGIYTQ